MTNKQQQLCMVLRKFGSGSVCNEESENFEKGSHTIKAMLPEDNTSNGMKENK